MDETKLKWLLDRADQIRTGEDVSVDIAGLLSKLNIEYRTVTGSSGHGELRRGIDGTLRVIIKTAEGRLLWDRQERFTAAHELGHALLLQEWQYRPQRGNQSEYFACEHMCNRFAGRLLVAPDSIEQIDCHDPVACLLNVRRIAEACLVSLEVVARELVVSRPSIAVCFVNTEARRIGWGVSSFVRLCETRNRKFARSAKDSKNKQEFTSDPIAACRNWLNDSLGGMELSPLVTGRLKLTWGRELVYLAKEEALAA